MHTLFLLSACQENALSVTDGAPQAVITSPVDGQTLTAGEPVTFVAAIEDDRDDASDLRIAWGSTLAGALTGEVTIDAGFAALQVASLPVGAQTITLQVIDSGGGLAEDAVDIVVAGNVAPSLAFVAPASGAAILLGSPVHVQVTVTDDGVVTDVALAWEGAAGPVTTDDNGNAEFFVEGLAVGGWTLAVTATDAGGAAVTATVGFSVTEEPEEEEEDEEGDGITLVDLGTADGVWRGIEAGDYAGLALAAGGDLDGDGRDDLVVGAYGAAGGGMSWPGRAYVVTGSVTGTHALGDADGALWGEYDGNYTAATVAILDDQDGDGDDELLVGAPYADEQNGPGRIYYVEGPATGDRAIAGAETAHFEGTDTDGFCGGALATVGDQDGDGRRDVLIGAQNEDGGGTNAGRVYVVADPGSAYGPADALAEIGGTADATYLGWSVAGAGDLDGDGTDDLVIGAPYVNVQRGAVYIFSGGVRGKMDTSDAEAVLTGEKPDDYAGYAVAGVGDTDGDGLAEVLIGAPYEDTGDSGAGSAFLFRGPVLSSSMSAADAQVVGTTASNQWGKALAALGDLDGDGFDDIAVASPYWPSYEYGLVNAGGTSILRGPLGGAVLATSGEVVIVAERSGDQAGSTLAVGDLDGDGGNDLVLGAPYEQSNGSTSGAAYVLFGAGL